jgi:lysosomal Pro-X carboxypeptidase
MVVDKTMSPITSFPFWGLPCQYHNDDCIIKELPWIRTVSLSSIPRDSERPTLTRTSEPSIMTESLTYQSLHYNNTLDHLFPFSPTGPRTFSHRYLLNDTYFGAPSVVDSADAPPPLLLGFQEENGGCRGPIFMYAGNEGDITEFWESNGFMQYLTVKYGGLLLFPEERYYGETMPTPTAVSPYLTTQQVLEDYVELLHHVKTLAAFLRLAYPFAVQGALAASSELGYYDVDRWAERGITDLTFSNIVASQYLKTEGCLEAIWDAADMMDAVAESGDRAEIDSLLGTFHFCEASALAPQGSATFVYALEGLPQRNYPYAVGGLPAWPVQVACEIMTNHSTPLLDRAAIVTAMSLGYDLNGGECLSTLEEGPGNVPGDGPGGGSWGYQSCTETIHTFSSVARDYTRPGLRNYNYHVEIANLTSLCSALYNAVPLPDILARRYGGFDIARTTTNTIFSTGVLDPWGGAALSARDGGEDSAERGVYFFRIPNGAHHLDLRGWNDADPDDVTKVRRQEEEIIVSWIQQWAIANSDPNTYAVEEIPHGSLSSQTTVFWSFQVGLFLLYAYALQK